MVRPWISALVENAHAYRYRPHGLAATRVFLAATRKTLGFNMEAWNDQVADRLDGLHQAGYQRQHSS